jgi:hypothetical protein
MDEKNIAHQCYGQNGQLVQSWRLVHSDPRYSKIKFMLVPVLDKKKLGLLWILKNLGSDLGSENQSQFRSSSY